MEVNQYLDPEEVQRVTYSDFVCQVETQVPGEGKSEPGSRAYYRELNLHRMKRIDKTFQFDERLLKSLSTLNAPQQWIVITEGWCGDCAQSLPIINRIADLSQGRVQLKIILRDENPDWIEHYHTNGSRSIPKLIAFDDNGNVLFTWGPRPEPAQELLQKWKENPRGRSWSDFEIELHTWYAKDKGKSLQAEFTEIFDSIAVRDKKVIAA